MSVRNEWDCIDLKCSHFDGDMCTLGDCLDPPEHKPTEYDPDPTVVEDSDGDDDQWLPIQVD